jgi:hypothetical protein
MGTLWSQSKCAYWAHWTHMARHILNVFKFPPLHTLWSLVDCDHNVFSMYPPGIWPLAPSDWMNVVHWWERLEFKLWRLNRRKGLTDLANQHLLELRSSLMLFSHPYHSYLLGDGSCLICPRSWTCLLRLDVICECYLMWMHFITCSCKGVHQNHNNLTLDPSCASVARDGIFLMSLMQTNTVPNICWRWGV